MVGKDPDTCGAVAGGVVGDERIGFETEHRGDAADEGAHVDGLGKLGSSFALKRADLLDRKAGAGGHVADGDALGLAGALERGAEAFGGGRM